MKPKPAKYRSLRILQRNITLRLRPRQRAQLLAWLVGVVEGTK